jgi:small-conductance mechanosensitive channel
MISSFAFLKRYFPLLLKQFKINKREYKRWVYVIEVFLIILGLLVFSSLSLTSNIILSVSLLIILIFVLFFLAQFFIKDFIAGLLFKASKEYRIGDQISTENISGRIERFTRTQLKIKGTDGKNSYIPYSILISKSKNVEQASEKINAYSFVINLRINKSFEEDIKQLKSYIQNLAWIYPSFDPVIDLLEEDEKVYKLNVTIYAFDKKYYRKIEKAIQAYTYNNWTKVKKKIS